MKKVYVFLANGFEEVEAFTPIDYLRRVEEIEALTVGVGGKMIEGAHGITTVADITLFDIDMENVDMLVLPGGMPGTLNLNKSSQVQEALKTAVERGIFIGAICAAPSILGQQGYLKGKRATCFDGFEDQLIGALYTGAPVEIDGQFITSRGAGTAQQFAFALVEKLISKQRAEMLMGAVKWMQ